MLFAPKCIGNIRLDPATLEQDKKHCTRIGSCGIGEKAIYLNSFFIDRTYYVAITDLRRCFKRVAMSKGGFSGRGIFGSMPYLVVQFSNGTEKQCNFKFEEDVDRFLQRLQKDHPEIPIYSKEAEKKLEAARIAEEARYVKNLSDKAQHSIHVLEHAKTFLEKKPEVSENLSEMAKRKRSVDGVKASNLFIAAAILFLSIAAAALGAVSIARGEGSWAKYFVLFGFAGMFFTAAAGILPTAKHNKKSVQKDWDQAVSKAQSYIESYDGEESFPVPATYAHPVVIDRVIRVIREGRAEEIADAFRIMEADLKSLDRTKTVTQKEYDEIIAVKPMFLVMNYQ